VNHVVLLGDSIFDNAVYVPDGRAVIEHLRACLPDGWQATLLAVDGSVLRHVPEQLDRLPADATHIVVSVGGNDVLGHSDIVYQQYQQAGSVVNIVSRLIEIRSGFQRSYREMLEAVVAHGLPVAVCTIYDQSPFPSPELQPVAAVALSVFNDIITREAARFRVPVLDLRLVCDEATDYSTVSPIEPSAAGGAKIAAGIARIVLEHDFRRGETVLFG